MIYYQTSEFNENWKSQGANYMTHSVIRNEAGEVAKITAPIFTFIQTNGSKWLGQRPDTIEDLYRVLQTEPLNPSFEKYGNFVELLNKYGWYSQPGVCRFWGNFAKLSHCFSIDTNDPEVIDNLIALISANQSTQEYQRLK